jgi:hypothetical protein
LGPEQPADLEFLEYCSLDLVLSSEGPAGKLYLAYVRDPIGNKICAMLRVPK